MIFLNAVYLSNKKNFVFRTEGEGNPLPSDFFSLFPTIPYECSVTEAIEKILPRCSERFFLQHPPVIVSYELKRFSSLLRFAASLVVKQSYIPSVDDGYAHWLPVMRHEDREIFSKIIIEGDEWGESLLAAFVDSIVRASVSEFPQSGVTSHERWINALLTPVPLKTELEEEIVNWRRTPLLRLESPMRIRVSLIEPRVLKKKTAPEWGIRCEVSSDGKKFTDILKAVETEENRDFLFHALSKVSRLSFQISDALKSGLKIETAAALENFVYKVSPILTDAGIEFQKPWWGDLKTREKAKIKIRADVSPMDDINRTFAAKVKVAWKVILNGNEISTEELKNFKLNPITLIDDSYALLSRDEISGAMKYLKKSSSEIGAYEVLRMSLDKSFEVVASGWIGELISRLDGRESFSNLPAPDGFKGDLRPYQMRGYSWLEFMISHGLGACLADDMGLGKTPQALALMVSEQRSCKKTPILLICPTSLIENWRREAEKFTPSMSLYVHHGIARLKNDYFARAISSSDVVVTSYALAARDAFIREFPWSGIVIDEAQNIKNPDTAQSRTIREMNGGWRIALSGTPVENNIGDLWSQMEFLNPGILGSWGEYNRTCVREYKKTLNSEILDGVKRMTSPFILRRLKTDKSIISDLPEKIETKQFCDLTDEQIELYEKVIEDMDKVESSDGIQRKGIILSMLLRLKQVCDHPLLYSQSVGGPSFKLAGMSGKLERLREIAEEAVGEKMLIFSQFAGMTDLIKKYMEDSFGEECLVMHGGIERKQRDALVQRFNRDPNARFFAMTMKTGGTGLNLTSASQVVLFDRWWNPAVEQQAIDRAFRIGQTRNVQVHSFVCSGTLEDWIDALINDKKNVAGRVVSDGEQWLLTLSPVELRKVIQYGGRRQ